MFFSGGWTPEPRCARLLDVFDITGRGAMEIVVRTAIVYAFLVIGIRLSGKREVGQMTPFDLVVLLLLSNAVQNAMTGPDVSIAGGLVAAVTLFAVNAVVSRLRMRSRSFRSLVVGVPVILVSHGELVRTNLDREQITEDDLLAALREHEAENVTDVEQATLEVDGTISVIRRAGVQHLVSTRKRLKRKSLRRS
jgi:uncharacterized membrane protein YcaP (DUF421 family)